MAMSNRVMGKYAEANKDNEVIMFILDQGIKPKNIVPTSKGYTFHLMGYKVVIQKIDNTCNIQVWEGSNCFINESDSDINIVGKTIAEKLGQYTSQKMLKKIGIPLDEINQAETVVEVEEEK